MRSIKRLLAAILAHYLMTSLGYFAFLATLTLIAKAFNLPGTQVALISSLFFLTSNLAKVFLGNLLDQIAMKISAIIGCLVCAAGMMLLALSSHTLTTVALAVITIGFGTSINGLASKQIVAFVSDSVPHRETLFSMISVTVNLAAAVSAPLALHLLTEGLIPLLLRVIASIYLIAAVILSVSIPSMHRVLSPRPASNTTLLREFRNLLQLNGMIKMLIFNALCWLCYSQLFSVVAIHIATQFHAAAQFGYLLSVNAILIIVFQLIVLRLYRTIFPTNLIYALVLGFLFFSISFLMLSNTKNWLFMYIFIVFFSIGEMLFGPYIDALYLLIVGQHNRGSAYSLLAISTATGEAVGAGAGIVLYELLNRHSASSNYYWYLLSGAGLFFALFSFLLLKRSGSNRLM